VRTRPTASAPHPPRALRYTAVLATAAVLASAPGIAQAVFTSSATGQTSVSTLTLAKPTGAAITATCNNSLFQGNRLRISVTSYGTVPGATSLQFIVKNPSGAPVTTSGGTYNQNRAAGGIWTAEIRGVYDVPGYPDWTGASFTKEVECN
jgi:hypothetical protein